MKLLVWPFALLVVFATARGGIDRRDDLGDVRAKAGSAGGGAGAADATGGSAIATFAAPPGGNHCLQPALLGDARLKRGETQVLTCCATGWQVGPRQLK